VNVIVVFADDQGKEVQELVGVVGVDVPWKEILDGMIPHRLNPLNYFFALDQNGIVVYHPNLPDQLPLEQVRPSFLSFLYFFSFSLFR
jgi:hypothetical protein